MMVRITINDETIRKSHEGQYLIDAVMHFADEITPVTFKLSSWKAAEDMIENIKNSVEFY